MHGVLLAPPPAPSPALMPENPIFWLLGGAFGRDAALPAGPMRGVCCREFPRSLGSTAHPSCCWIYELCVCFVIKQLIALEFLISFGGW